MTTEEFYNVIGADYQTALSRMMGNEGLLVRMLKKFMDDKNYAALEAAVAAKDYEGVFTAAHTIKGVAGNLELTPLYETSARLADAARGGNAPADLPELFAAVREAYEKVTGELAGLA